MANTINDVSIGNTWTDIYAATSIASGKSVIIQNKGSVYIVVATNAPAPTAGTTNGYVVSPFESCIVDSGEAGLWARSVQQDSTATINVQEA